MRSFLLKFCLPCLVLLLCTHTFVQAAHIIGGEITYKFLDSTTTGGRSYRYLLTFNIYIDEATSGAQATGLQFAIYHANTNQRIGDAILLDNPEPVNITPVLPPGCRIPGIENFGILLFSYETIVTLPYSSEGYHIIYERCCRNDEVVNLQPFSGNTFYAFIAAPDLPNNSAVFSEVAIPYICVRDTNTVVNNAVDADGDRLEYRFVRPYTGGTREDPVPQPPFIYDFPPDLVSYNADYNYVEPFGENSVAQINLATGITNYAAPSVGNYVVAIEVREYRAVNDSTEVLVGIVRRELQLLVGDCPVNNMPKFSSASTDTLQYNVEAGEKLCFTVEATDIENDSLVLSATGDILLGTNGYSGPLASFPAVIKKGSVSSPFCWQTTCDTPPGTYQITVKAQDKGCPPKTNTVIYLIKLLPVRKKPVIRGSKSVCPGVTLVDYSVEARSGYTYAWTVDGGTIASGQGNASIKVNWGLTNPSASVAVLLTSQAGCQSEEAILPVKINKALTPPEPEGPDTLCVADGRNLLYEIVYTNGSTYQWQISGGKIISQQLNQVTVSWETAGKGLLWVKEFSNQAEICEGISDTLSVLLYASPDSTLTIAGKNSMCALEKGISYTLSGAPDSDYTWEITGGTIVSGQHSPTILVDWNEEGTHQLSVQETSVAGCSGKLIAISITVHPNPTTGITGNDLTICPQGLTNKTYTVQGNDSSTFQWTIGGGEIISGQGTSQILVNWQAEGVKTLTVHETTASGCTGQIITFPLVVDASAISINYVSVGADLAKDSLITLTFQAVNTSNFGHKLSVHRQNLTSGGPWESIQTNLSSATTGFTDQPLPTQSNTYQYKVSLVNACGFVVEPLPHQTILLAGEANEKEESTTLHWNAYKNWPLGVRQYEIWRQLDQSSQFELYEIVSNQTYSYTKANAKEGFYHCYKIKAIAEHDIHTFSWSNAACLSFQHELVLYNVITPNQDGYNDRWQVTNIELYPDNELVIYNRWGKEVYRKQKYSGEWEGAGLSNGIYYYTLTISSTDYTTTNAGDGFPASQRLIKGWISLLR
ncbi:T9SS type B sorting domain-containing protein [Rhodocytophaga rosea]|uniref:T9SS type B sorting domain-containing protein n=1 Tax=Rhodocytophaga rosea TaxID=2704465 RepID=A0A6C0GFD0_9BACT|nr:gliding motility-associated C-terminal domain-containing protein [Rhodocytophaga rosea]QHT66473.1 T9SS type B sorting domain-containing protein [Rhodocytophaga rosea]